MPPKRLLLVVNPVASRVDDRAVERALEALRPYALTDVTRSERQGHAAELAAAARDGGYDAVAVLAGDGTANEVLNGVGADLPVGVLPGGGTSVLARALGLPRSVPAAARHVGAALASGRERRIALGTLNGRRFAFAAGLGADAATVRRVDERGRARGRRPGDAYYLLQTVRTLRDPRWHGAALTVDVPGAAPIRGASLLVANAHPWSYVGRLPLRLTPRATFEGGLDAVVPESLAPQHAAAYARYLLLTGGHARGRDARVHYLHDVRELSVRCDVPTPAEVDGDDLGDLTEATFGLVPDGARMLA